MIRTLTAYTTELDDEKAAIEQVMSRLGSLDGLLKNTIGVMACHYEFVLSGIYKAVCEALPFEVFGTISSAQSVPGESGSLLMTLTVMTSDDVEFVGTVTPSLMTEPARVIADSYKAVCRIEKPALALIFAPFILQNCGDDYVNVLRRHQAACPASERSPWTIHWISPIASCFQMENITVTGWP